MIVREDKISDRDAAERAAYEAAAPERATKAKADADAQAAAAAAEVARKAKEEKDAAATYSATFFANLETARKRPLDRASWVPFGRDFTSRRWDSIGLGVNLNYAFAGGDNSTAVNAALVSKEVREMAVSEALTQEIGGVASTMIVSCFFGRPAPLLCPSHCRASCAERRIRSVDDEPPRR